MSQKQVEHQDDSKQEKEQEHKDNNHLQEKQKSEQKQRERSKSRSKSKSRSRSRSRQKKPKHLRQQQQQQQHEANDLPEDDEMMKVMGFSKFGSSKNKNHTNSACEAVRKNTHVRRQYRQYMNRRGGFNRNLDKI